MPDLEKEFCMTIPPVDFSVSFVAAVAGVVLSLALTYIPGLRVWYAGLTSQIKSLIMLGLMVICSVTILLLAFYNILPVIHPVTWSDVVSVVVLWMMANQATYTLAPVLDDAYHAKFMRDENLLG